MESVCYRITNNGVFVIKILTQNKVSKYGFNVRWVTKCSRDLACVSFFYNKYSEVCQTKSVQFQLNSYVEPEYGNSYYTLYQENCPVDFVRNRKYDLCYKPFMNNMAKTVNTDYSNCDNDGYVLVSAKTDDAYRHICDQLMVTDEGNADYTIDGEEDFSMNGEWWFSNDEQMLAFIWGPDEPSNESDFYYVHLHVEDGKCEMQNTPYYYDSYYICQFQPYSDVEPEYDNSYYTLYQENCPVDFVRNRKYDLCYKPFLNMVYNVDEAYSNCENDGYVIVRAKTDDAYRHICDQLMVTDNGYGEYIIDGKEDISMNGDWWFSNDEQMLAFIWGPNQPIDVSDFYYLHLHIEDGKCEMQNTPYSYDYYYICQIFPCVSLHQLVSSYPILNNINCCLTSQM
ncbi:hypothetical protein LOTGIDRAFT_170877 [Lottia gigantea]|uniref:C-type lectin domain-containing protein n=1 Tax=Lottia gigantea TaxID=225164 RepID=V4CPP6_LOTGI|nr:hypothetical protein LOTGIDRAFT_170877 [Lottia gigantea]ESP04375.1 hypothetical protein LOTGIDRAFT_170877 [Lottia gigantea]